MLFDYLSSDCLKHLSSQLSEWRNSCHFIYDLNEMSRTCGSLSDTVYCTKETTYALLKRTKFFSAPCSHLSYMLDLNFNNGLFRILTCLVNLVPCLFHVANSNLQKNN